MGSGHQRPLTARLFFGQRSPPCTTLSSGTKHPAPRGRITRPFTAGFERVVAITSYARLQVATMRLAQRHAGVGVAAALRIVLVVVHCSSCFCQGVRSTFAQCTAAAGRLYGWRPAEGRVGRAGKVGCRLEAGRARGGRGPGPAQGRAFGRQTARRSRRAEWMLMPLQVWPSVAMFFKTG